jgi:competence ComEA-like helix-hairpin-helix protein
MRILTDELGLVSDSSIGPLEGYAEHSPDIQYRYQLTSDYLIDHLREWLRRPTPTRRDQASARRSEAEIRQKVDRININAATEEELTKLPGIGVAMARRLVAARPFSAVADLREVKGIGAKTLQDLGPLIGLE